MSTIIYVHAHPDDETGLTSGVMALAAQRGHRVVEVFCTNGDHGERHDQSVTDAQCVAVRKKEALASAQIIGIDGVYWLGYKDSGMTGWPQNQDPAAFMNADVDDAANRLVAVFNQVRPDVIIGYDGHGNYGHPDHIQTHRVTKRAWEIYGNDARYLEATSNRDRRRLAGRDHIGDDGNPVGTDEADLNWEVNVSAALDTKRRAMRAHSSQSSDIGYFLSMDPEDFVMSFSYEYFIEPGVAGAMVTGWPFDDEENPQPSQPQETEEP